MVKKVIFSGLFLLNASVFSAPFPVDDEIDILRGKAQYLEDLKNLFLKNQCAIQLDNNRVPIAAGALRSEGLVMAVGPGFPGNYLGFHKAPKPEMLERVVSGSFMSADKGKGASIIGVRMDGSKESIRTVAFFVAEPLKVDGAEDLWMYNKTVLTVRISEKTKEIQSIEKRTPRGILAKITCN